MTTVAPASGELIGDYEILERIGGNMGLVFKARHRLLDKVVALKLVPADWLADPARLARFQREMRVMGQLEHPNLVTAADARSVDEWHLVAMELIDGVDLQQLVRTRGPLPVAAACEAGRQAAQGLQYAHEHGLIHRDIKPSNLMLTRTGTVKVIDMGLALAREDSTAELTQTGLVLGTMSYCAPEQFRDASHVDIRADIYSLGCTLYHLLTGKSPYWPRKTFAEIMQAHLHEPFPGLAETLPDAPAGLEAVLARMTAKDREKRFSTPREVVEALELFSRGADLAVLVPAKTQQGASQRVSQGKPSPTPHRHSATSPPQQPSARWPRMAALVALLLVVAGALFLAINHRERQSVVTNQPAVTNRAPVVVLMDTTADRGVYDDENKGKGVTNAEELEKVLRHLPLGAIYKEQISINWIYTDWVGEARVLGYDPDLVVIHRSSFFHPLNAKLEFGYPPFTNNPAHTNDMVLQEKWDILYRVGDTMLISFLGNIAAAAPRTKFLVYSRGTDKNWLDKTYRQQWVNETAARIPTLKGRLDVMLIPGLQKGTFKDAKTAEEITNRVKTILDLPEEAK